jgi:hypothetical protein
MDEAQVDEVKVDEETEVGEAITPGATADHYELMARSRAVPPRWEDTYFSATKNRRIQGNMRKR